MAIVGFYCWFPVAPLRGCIPRNPPVLTMPRSGRPSADFDLPKQFGVAPPSKGAAGGGRGPLRKGSKEEPGISASKTSKGVLGSGSGTTPDWNFVGYLGYRFFTTGTGAPTLVG